PAGRDGCAGAKVEGEGPAGDDTGIVAMLMTGPEADPDPATPMTTVDTPVAEPPPPAARGQSAEIDRTLAAMSRAASAHAAVDAVLAAWNAPPLAPDEAAVPGDLPRIARQRGLEYLPVLRRAGANDVVENGAFDAATTAAVLDFQRARLLFADGRVGRLTRIVLYGAAGGYPRPTLVTGGGGTS